VTGRAPVAPPGGAPPPISATLSDGTSVDLRPLAARIADEHLRRHPEDAERYGDDLARQWCTHDNQHILNWAVGDLDLNGQLAWLARILDARGYPVVNLIDTVTIGAEVIARELATPAAQEVSTRMRRAAETLSGRSA
jgi:hypothetical protein